MKICIVGLGSIGKRHLDNLRVVLERRKLDYQIDALRSKQAVLEEKCHHAICRQYYCVDEMPDDYDAVFITNPTSLHFVTVQAMLDKTKHMFIEKPVFASVKHDFSALKFREYGIYYVACPLRHKSIMEYVRREIVGKQQMISARILSTSYLPAWRKNRDYRRLYSAKQDMGGGVTRDLIHEWDYAIYLFGIPEKVYHMQGHFSSLEIDSDDISVYVAKYPKMILEIHLDYIGQKTERILEIFTNECRINIDLISNTIHTYENNRLVRSLEFPHEDFYIREMEYFFDCIEKKQVNMNTVADAYRTLQIALTKE